MSTAADPLTDPELLETEWDLDPLVDGDGTRAGVERKLDEARTRATTFAQPLRGQGRRARRRRACTTRCASSRRSTSSSARPARTPPCASPTDTADPARGALLQLMQERATEIETKLLFFELEWAALDDDRAEELLAADAPRLLPPPPAQRPPLPPAPALRARGEDPRREVDLEPDRLGAAVRRAGRGAAGRRSTAQRADARRRAQPPPVARPRDPPRGRRGGLRRRSSRDCARAGFIYNTLVYDKSVEDRLRHYPHWLASRNLVQRGVRRVRDGADRGGSRALRHPAALVRAEGQAARASTGSPTTTARRRCCARTSASRSARRASSCSTPTSRSRPRPARSRAASSTSAGSTRRSGPHKRGGAFCSYTVPSVHPYVLLNFTATRRDVLTMAHELGHGLHAALAQPQGVFHQSTPLTLAETASVFGEALVFGRHARRRPTTTSSGSACSPSGSTARSPPCSARSR